MKTTLFKTAVFLFLLMSIGIRAQKSAPTSTTSTQPAKKNTPAKTAKKVYNDFSCILHEEVLNKVFDAMGEITGTNQTTVMAIPIKYHWTVINPKIHLKPDSSDFTCDAKVECGPIDYKTEVKGQVKIWYDNAKNLINVQITTAIFELYTKILGKKIHIKDIELAEYLKDPFQFEGPKTMGTDFEFMTPDSVTKKIYIQPDDCEMEVMYKMIATRCEVKVSDKPLVPAAPTTPPKPATNNNEKAVVPDTTKKKK